MEAAMKTSSHVSIRLAILSIAALCSCSTDVGRQSAENLSARGTWSTLAPMPIEISEVTVAASGGKIYVIGGSTGDVVDQRLNQEYDIATNRWRNRAPLPRGMTHARSEEHTSELQSHVNLVCRLLLEKKKKI